jgi:PAS domain S-box-containing protein
VEGNYLQNELYDLINKDKSVFEFIQSGSLDGIWYWDLENPESEWMSPKFWETLGYNPDEKKHLSSEWQDIIFQEDLKIAVENLEKHCDDSNHPYDQIVRYTHKNGSTVWIRCRGLAIRDEKGKAIRMLGAHTDITNLKRKENEIHRLKEEYEKVFNGTQDAIFLIRVFENGEFRYVRNNLAHQNKTGILLEEIKNKSPQELLGKKKGDIVTENYRKCALVSESITYEEELSFQGGDRIWLTTLTPIIKENKVTHIVGSATDITERKKLELELERHANYDKLTGLPNRKLFFEVLDRMILENERDNMKFALLFVDLDGFKDINDNFGHEVGDEVLI